MTPPTDKTLRDRVRAALTAPQWALFARRLRQVAADFGKLADAIESGTFEDVINELKTLGGSPYAELFGCILTIGGAVLGDEGAAREAMHEVIEDRQPLPSKLMS